ncbi:mitotic deacetylase-associated SANT domain protein [Protopterus annectens]|uniref:mitotic deacetylase-associated SANT domain protein n=1 Tax=Protopterus annectens TaxID=7888 RepID=UPI001CFAA063|nr:mitotic deacetylase-associated SANT domain protein [Protopterus annectens]
MSLPVPQKTSTKRTGKKISFFTEQNAQAVSRQSQSQKGGVQCGVVPSMENPQAIVSSKSDLPSSVSTCTGTIPVIFAPDRHEQLVLQASSVDQQPQVKWTNSVMANCLPDRGETTWHPSSTWNQNVTVYDSNQKGGQMDINVGNQGFLSQMFAKGSHQQATAPPQETLKRNAEKSVSTSQAEQYGDSVQQILSQNAQLEQLAAARQSPYNFVQVSKQQQQQQTAAYPLQSFRIAFGSQGQKPALSSLYLFPQQPPVSTSSSLTSQQKSHSLPHLPVFENYYHQQTATHQLYPLQQAVVSQGSVAPTPQLHLVGHSFQQAADVNQDALHVLAAEAQTRQQLSQQSQNSQPRRSRRLSKENASQQPSVVATEDSNPVTEQENNPFMLTWQQQQQLQMQQHQKQQLQQLQQQKQQQLQQQQKQLQQLQHQKQQKHAPQQQLQSQQQHPTQQQLQSQQQPSAQQLQNQQQHLAQQPQQLQSQQQQPTQQQLQVQQQHPAQQQQLMQSQQQDSAQQLQQPAQPQRSQHSQQQPTQQPQQHSSQQQQQPPQPQQKQQWQQHLLFGTSVQSPPEIVVYHQETDQQRRESDPCQCKENSITVFGAQTENGKIFMGPDINIKDAQSTGQTNSSQDGALRTDACSTVPGGVIQSTKRKRRISQEANLHTLAQQAVERSLMQMTAQKEAEQLEEKKKDEAAKENIALLNTLASKKVREDGSLMPLIIPVSVPVKRTDVTITKREWPGDGKPQKNLMQPKTPSEQKSSVIVTRRKSRRNSLTDSSVQDDEEEEEEEEPKEDEEGLSRKLKRRPRPEPLYIPPKPGTFIVPTAYSTVTSYQSHLRSPIRLLDPSTDRSFELPPYTPPPILSPVREGSGLYFNAIMSVSSNNSVQPSIIPKPASQSLLRSGSSEITPPILSRMGDGTPVSLEPRINISPRFQAEIPELQDISLVDLDDPKSDQLWTPWPDLEPKPGSEDIVENILNLACSSAVSGAGTNQELAFHCLHESKGNILDALKILLKGELLRPKNHPLATYHYTGSDRWTAQEKRLFNKGITVYKKDFFLVQKLIKTKTVAQCVEFYYTYKKQVKIGRNGTLLYGDIDVTDEKCMDDEVEVDVKNSHRFDHVAPIEMDLYEEEETPKGNETPERKPDPTPLKITQTLQASENSKDVLILKNQEFVNKSTERPKEPVAKPRQTPPPPNKKKPIIVNKSQNQENTFPCKKCGKVFYKVKSRSAHMKSHSEQEKKAAALRLKQSEEALLNRLKQEKGSSDAEDGGA